MSVEKIIQESINKNPLGVKEAFELELQERIRLALESRFEEAMKESKDEDEEDEDEEDEDEEDEDEEDEDEEDMDESFDLSDYTVEELEDFVESAEFDQLDEISKDLARRYIKGAKDDMAVAQKYHRVGAGDAENTRLYQKRKAGVAKAMKKFS